MRAVVLCGLKFIGSKHMESERKNSNSNTQRNGRGRSSGKSQRFAVCIQGTGFDMLAHKVYKILKDPKAEKFGFLRVIDESGEDYMYPASWFIPVKADKDAEARLADALASPPPPDRPVLNAPRSFLETTSVVRNTTRSGLKARSTLRIRKRRQPVRKP